MKTFFATLFSRDSLKHFAFMAAFAIIVFVTVSVSINNYTDHGFKMPVPDLVGLQVDAAQRTANAMKLDVLVVDSVYAMDAEPGAIIAHTPAAGFNVKHGRRIFLTINSVLPEFIKMPDLLNTSLRQAKEVLRVHKLELGKIGYSPDFAKNYVLAQNYQGQPIPKGAKIARGAKIDLVLGLGSSNKEVLMPNLIDLPYESAMHRIRTKSLVVGAEMFPEGIETLDDSSKTKVYRQVPSFEEGKFVKIGTLVDIWLERDSALLDTLPEDLLPQ